MVAGSEPLNCQGLRVKDEYLSEIAVMLNLRDVLKAGIFDN